MFSILSVLPHHLYNPASPQDTHGNQPSKETRSPQDSPRLTPEVTNYPATFPSSPGERNGSREDVVVSREKVAESRKDQWYGNLNSLIQHLRSGGEKRKAEDVSMKQPLNLYIPDN